MPLPKATSTIDRKIQMRPGEAANQLVVEFNFPTTDPLFTMDTAHDIALWIALIVNDLLRDRGKQDVATCTVDDTDLVYTVTVPGYDKPSIATLPQHMQKRLERINLNRLPEYSVVGFDA